MTQHIPFPADTPVHSLDYWLSPELARVSPPDAPSRLRQLADAQGTVAAGWSSAIAGGPVLAFGGAFFSVMSGNPAPALVLLPLGAVLMLLGLFGWKRVQSALPRTDKVLITIALPDPIDPRADAPVFNRTVTLRDTWAKQAGA